MSDNTRARSPAAAPAAPAATQSQVHTQQLTASAALAGLLKAARVVGPRDIRPGDETISLVLFEDEKGWRLVCPVKQGEYVDWTYTLAVYNKPKNGGAPKPTPATYDPDEVPF